MKTIAIIGAGMAGLSCARVLTQAGNHVRLFEKSRGVSGRMSTRRGDGWECDHGAQYFTATDSRFEEEVFRWVDAGVARRWLPRLSVIGGDRSAARAAETARYVGEPRMTSPAMWLAESLAVSLNTTINSLSRENDKWVLHSAESGRVEGQFDWLVLAIPAPQAKVLLRDHDTGWEPQFDAATMLPCWTIMVQTEGQMDPGFDAAFVNGGPLGWVARNTSKPGRTGAETWVLQATDEWSLSHLEEQAETVEAELVAAFRAMTGLSVVSRKSHRWRYSRSKAPLQLGYLMDAARSLGACGDWAGGDKVQGAWLSGLSMGQRIIELNRGLPAE
jgi:renalase